MVQLQKSYKSFEQLDTEIIAVFREESKGIEGLQMSQERIGAKFPLLLDADAAKTAEYSQQGFNTYVIDRQGIVRGTLKGIKTQRPTTEKVLEEVQKLAPARPDVIGK